MQPRFPRFLNFPAEVVDPLRALSDQDRAHVSAFLRKAAGYLEDQPPAGVLCETTDNCLPIVRRESPLCPLCAVDAAVDRLSAGFDPETVTALRRTATVAKQALIYLMEANPAALTATDAAQRFADELAFRTGHSLLNAETVADAQERHMLFRCHMALTRASSSGRIRETDPEVLASLEKRGWALGGHVTPQGKFAHERHARDIRNDRRTS